jgi:HK97 family phage portal protein
MRNLISSVVSRGKPPVPYSAGGAFSHQLVSTYARRTMLEQMTRNPTVFAVVNTLSMAVAKADWKLYRKSTTGNDDDRVEIAPDAHAASKLWSNPNGWWSRNRLVRAGEQHQELTGLTYFVVQKYKSTNSIPIGLWPMRPDRVFPVAGDSSNYLQGWIYRGPDGSQTPLRVDEVLEIVTPDPMDPYGGISPVASLLPTLDAARFSQLYARNFYLNDATPGGVIEVPTKLSDPEWTSFQKRWAETHKGVDKAHRIAMLENGMAWKTVDPSNRDNQFVESRQDQRDEITEGWAFPKSMLGASNDVNRAVAEANRATFAENLVVPRLDAWRDMLNTNYLPLFGPTADGIEFDYVSPVPADKLLEAQVNQALSVAVRNLVQVGYDGDAVAEWADLPEMTWERPAVATAPENGSPDDQETAADAADPDAPEPNGAVPAAAFRKRLATNGHPVPSWGAL